MIKVWRHKYGVALSIGVVGCGIAGLTVSYHLLSSRNVSNVSIFERRTLVPRKHCTGVVSLETLSRLPLAPKFVENMYRSIVFIIHGIDFGLEIAADRYFACRIDRVRHEIELMRSLNEMGATVNLGYDVRDVVADRNSILIRVKKSDTHTSMRFDRIVLAEGYPPTLSMKCGLSSRYEALKSVQEEVALSSSLSEEVLETLYVFISPEFFGRGFAWLVPIERRKVVIGYSTEYSSSLKWLEIVKLIFKNILRLSYRSTEDLYGGISLQGHPVKVLTNGVVGIGDTVAMVKSISGGGLYAISIASKLYSRIINAGAKESYKELKKLISALKMQYAVKNTIWSLLRIAKSRSTGIGRVNRVVHIGVDYMDYDKHELFAYNLIINLHGVELGEIHDMTQNELPLDSV